MRSFGPVPFTFERSTPSSRANARTEGEACARLKASVSTGAAAGVGAEGAAAGAGFSSATRGAAAGAGADGASAAAGAAAPLADNVRSTLPSLTLSPTFTFSACTVPADGEGTSIVALSDSSVTSGSSALTASPALTNTSMIGTSLKSPMSGTLTSVLPPAGALGAVARGAALAPPLAGDG